MLMASLNVAEWSVDQVADWLSGLGPTVERYVPELRARGLDGAKLLTLRCDDLEYLGVHVIGHQELLLEAVEHLRNFQYEISRECVQQLALRVSVVATTLVRALRHHPDARLETQTLADVARTVHAVKPLVCWLDRWSLCAAGLAQRKAALLTQSLEAATCAQRDRFAEQPARAVAAAAAQTAATADYIIQDVSDPMILQPASLDTVTLRQRGKPLGFDVVPSFCGHHQLADIRFGSPAHASGAVHAGDEIVQVGPQCVVGWSGAAVVRLCGAGATGAGGAGGELALRLRRRGARAPPALATPQLRRPPRARHHLCHDIAFTRCLAPPPPPPAPPSPPAPKDSSPASSSDESEPLSPPASPTQLHMDHTRLCPPKPRALAQRRHTVCGAAPLYKRAEHSIEQFWQELRVQRCGLAPPEPDALYHRDKAVSCSTGLERSPRAPPRAPPLDPRPRLDMVAAPSGGVEAGGVSLRGAGVERARGKLDKSHSTPAYDFDLRDERAALHEQTIPESPTTPDTDNYDKADRILDFKKSSSQIGSAMERRADEHDRAVDAINVALLEHRADRSRAPEPPPRPTPPPRAPPALPPSFPVLRAVPREESPAPASPLKLTRPIDSSHISLPLRHITKHDIRMIPSERRELPAINCEAGEPSAPTTPPTSGKKHSGDIVLGAQAQAEGTPTRGLALSPTSAVRGIFPTSKTRSLKKKSSILAKRRSVSAKALAARGAGGAVWQRVRARAAAEPRWARRHLLLTHNLLYAYKTPECSKADCMIYLEGFTVSAAGEVKSRAHAFKVYHTGNIFYFACDTRDAMLAWIQLIHRATLLPSLASNMDISKQFSETDYSETESDAERPREDKDKDKSKFGSLRKLTHRMRSDSAEHVHSTSLDRKYLRFFSRKAKDDPKAAKSKPLGVPVPTEHYRSYRRVAGAAGGAVAPGGSGAPAPAAPPADLERGALGGSRRLPKPINYIHASNPNLLDFDKSDFVTKPTLHVPKQKPKTETLVGLVTLEQFMLNKQAEERRQLYTNRVLMGVEHQQLQQHQHDLRHRLDNIVPDVIYGEVGASEDESRGGKPVSVRGRDGYEKIVYRDEPSASPSRPAPPVPPAHSLRRNDKVHSSADSSTQQPGATSAAHAPVSLAPTHQHATYNRTGGAAWGARGGARGVRTQYPHLVCPPTFQPETYSLARLPPAHRDSLA